MKNFMSKFKFVLPVAAICLIWTVLVLVLADYDNAKGYFWSGFAFGLLGFIIVGWLMYYIPTKQSNTVRENVILLYIATIVYGIISLVINTVFVIISKVETPILPIVLNVIALIVFGVFMWITLGHMARVTELGKKIDQRVVSVQMTAIQIGSLIDIAEDEEIKARLKELKESVDYSDQVSVPAIKETEDRFRTAIFEIQTLLEENENKEEILKKIKSAQNLWKTRNSMLSTLR